MLVFVYGTLKSGEPNNFLLGDESPGTCILKGAGKTKERFPLVVTSRYNIPYMLYAPGTGHHINGEIYEVDDERLVVLDRLEAHPKLYERRETSVIPVTSEMDPEDMSAAGSQTDVMCFSYFLVKYRPELMELPMLETFKDNVDGVKYAGPEARAVNASWWHEVHTDYIQKQ